MDLLYAINDGLVDKAIALICNGADLTKTDRKYGDNALMIAASAAPREDPRGQLRLVEVLVEFIDVNKANSVGVTALHGAAWAGCREVVEFLLTKGADRYARTYQGQTARELAEMHRFFTLAALL